MDDLISRKALIDYVKAWQIGCGVGHDQKTFINAIEEQPPAEAVSVVHCKDCEHWGTGIAGETEHVKCCEYGKYMVGENGFCCYADMRKKVQDEKID